jgi:phosphoglycolate phosphatase
LYTVAIFDFDGTLVDSVPGIVQTMREVVEDMGLDLKVWEEWSKLIGVPLIGQMQTLFPDRDAAFHEQMATNYRKRYDARLLDACPPFPRLEEMLSLLAKNKVTLTIATSKRRHMVEHVLHHHKLYDYFNLIIGSQDVSHHKPHRESVDVTLASLKAQPKEVVVIGDSTYDLEMAANAGVDAIGVTTGVHDEQVLKSARPKHIVAAIHDAVPLILG